MGDTPVRAGEADKRVEEPAATVETERESSADGLTSKERLIVAELQRIDQQVRAHEQAHLAAGGALTRGVSFTYTTGPDGRRYAVGGEVGIDTSAVQGDPEATIRKAQQIRAAANAPANPSAQDRAVAAQASAMEAQAVQELASQSLRALRESTGAARARTFEGDTGLQPGTILNVIA